MDSVILWTTSSSLPNIHPRHVTRDFVSGAVAAKFKAISYDYSTSSTYRSYCYIAACTVPGPILAGWAVDTRLGRRYNMALGTVLSGVFFSLVRWQVQVRLLLVVSFFVAIFFRVPC
jgi:hypothetical protein